VNHEHAAGVDTTIRRRMRLSAIVAACAALMFAAGAAAQPARGSVEGVWNFSTLTPLERPQEFADRPSISDAEAAAWVQQTLERNDRDRRDGGAGVDVARAVNDYWFDRGTELALRGRRRMTSLIIDPADGRLPSLTSAAQARLAAQNADNRQHPADGPENRSLQERCLSFNAGPPMLPGPYNNLVQIFQVPGFVVIVNEMIHDARIVPVDSSQRPPASVLRWQGESRGRWDGATLVIDSSNFLGGSTVRGADERLHITERLTRVNPETLNYEVTVDDPTAFTRAWTALLPMRQSTEPLFEYACHEGNHALMDILRGARYEETHK
jgi:hypothetical protein